MELTKDDFTNNNISSVRKVISVLNYLNQGRELDLGGWTIMIGETVDNGFKFLQKVKAWSSGETIEDAREEWIGLDLSVEDFSAMCAKLTEEELTVMSAELVITNFNKR